MNEYQYTADTGPVELQAAQTQYTQARSIRDLTVAAAHQEGMTAEQIRTAATGTGLHVQTIRKIIRQVAHLDSCACGWNANDDS